MFLIRNSVSRYDAWTFLNLIKYLNRKIFVRNVFLVRNIKKIILRFLMSNCEHYI